MRSTENVCAFLNWGTLDLSKNPDNPGVLEIKVNQNEGSISFSVMLSV